MSTDMRALSRTAWSTDGKNLEHINTGSFLRIADAMEKMALRHTDLMNDRDMYKRWYESEKANVAGLEYLLRAQKGAKTKLRNKLAARATGSEK